MQLNQLMLRRFLPDRPAGHQGTETAERWGTGACHPATQAAAAAKAYYGVLAAEEGAEALRESVPVLERSLTEAQAMQETGFMEETDVDRIRIELANP